jgi:hypothetical protein
MKASQLRKLKESRIHLISCFPTKTHMHICIPLLPMRATIPAYLILLTSKICTEGNKLGST